jgi:AraC-like DNA-binding protein
LRLQAERASALVIACRDFALADKQMSATINSMHDDPAHRWTLQELAERAGMSRSTFALKFKETVGASPMEYLTRWRMLLAGDKLVNSSDPISVIALSLGYESESAFGTAFKRVMGSSPRQYSRAAGIRLLLHLSRGKPPAPIGSNLSQFDMRAPATTFVTCPAVPVGRKVCS